MMNTPVMIFTNKKNTFHNYTLREKSPLDHIFLGAIRSLVEHKVTEKKITIFSIQNHHIDLHKKIIKILDERNYLQRVHLLDNYENIILKKKELHLLTNELKEILEKLINNDTSKPILLIIPSDIENSIIEEIAHHKDRLKTDFLLVSSDCETAFKKISENNDAIFIINNSLEEGCFSDYIRDFHEERPNLSKGLAYLENNYPLISVLPKKLSPFNNYNYNPMANVCNIISANEINKDSLDVKISKILNTLRNPKRLFFSYGSKGNSHKIIEKLERLIKIFFPSSFSRFDKVLENYNKPLYEYEKSLQNGDVVIFIINLKFLQSRYAMRELCNIYEKYISKIKYLNNKDQPFQGLIKSAPYSTSIN